MPVSAPEKKPERMTSAARMKKSKPSGASFKAGLDLGENSDFYLEEKAVMGQALWLGLFIFLRTVQYQLQHKFRAKKSQHEQYEARKCKAHGCLAAPAQLIVSPQQRGE